MEINYFLIACVTAITVGLLLGIKWVISLRRVVSSNEVHIVQRSNSTTSYGQGASSNTNGNTYYEWPASLPFIGVTKIILPVSVFKIDLSGYDAYDKDRLPFELDLVAFFRVNDSNMAAQRVSSLHELHDQLLFILKGAARSILSNKTIDEIMTGRGSFGDAFTKEVSDQLMNWGIETVRNIELMDIRDAKGSTVIANIMAKKKSAIEKESRTEVALNRQQAEMAEISAKQEVELQNQKSEQVVGLRKAEVAKAVGIAKEQAEQEIKEQARITKEKELAVIKVAQEQQAEIDKNVNIIQAEQHKQMTILKAEGDLEAKRKESEAITLEGTAKAEAEKQMQLAPVEAQIALAKEIGSNDSYQKYLVTVREIEAKQIVGIEQAKNLSGADVKIIANTGDVSSGVSSVLDLFTAKGGLNVGAALDSLANTDAGKAILDKFQK